MKRQDSALFLLGSLAYPVDLELALMLATIPADLSDWSREKSRHHPPFLAPVNIFLNLEKIN